MKKQINVKLLKYGSENDVITKMIANYNEGKVEATPRDIEGYMITRNCMYPTLFDFKLVKSDEPGEVYHISEDGGKTFTLTMDWVEVHELIEN